MSKIGDFWQRLIRARQSRPILRHRVPTIMQQEAVECGAAALAMVLAYFGRWVSPEELRQQCGVSRDGTKATNILRAARAYGLLAKGLKKESSELSSLPFPMIVFWAFNHFVVLEGIAGEKVWMNDPAQGPRQMTLKEFNADYSGVVLAFQPTEAFTPGGSPPKLLPLIAHNLHSVRTGMLHALLAGVGLLIPGIIVAGAYRIFVDDVMVRGEKDWLLPLLAGMIGASLVTFLLTLLQKHALMRAESALGTTLAVRYFWKTISLPLSFFAQRYGADIANRMSQVERMASQISSGLLPALIGIIPILGYGAALLLLDSVLAGIVALGAALALGLLSLSSRGLQEGNQKALNDEARLLGTTHQGLSMREDFRAAGTEGMFLKRWLGSQGQVLTTEQTLTLRSTLISEAASLLLSLAGVLVLVAGGMRIMDGMLSIGLLLTAQALMGNVTGPVLGLVGVGTRLQSIRGIADRQNDVMHYREASPPRQPGVEILSAERSFPLTLKEVSFTYGPGIPPVLDSFSLRLAMTERLALVGPSGSGKSTLGRLMVGLMGATQGEVRIFGRLLETWSAPHLRREVAYVEQNVGLFEGTIRDNITLWDETMGEANYVAAAQDAQIHDFITSRPGGYGARLLENGGNLSGGERQRIALARALATNPRLLVLDEATSALDPLTEAAIMDAIRRRGCSCVIIAHRLSSIKDCDRILVLERGRVVEAGRHQELLVHHGLYRRLLEN